MQVWEEVHSNTPLYSISTVRCNGPKEFQVHITPKQLGSDEFLMFITFVFNVTYLIWIYVIYF